MAAMASTTSKQDSHASQAKARLKKRQRSFRLVAVLRVYPRIHLQVMMTVTKPTRRKFALMKMIMGRRVRRKMMMRTRRMRKRITKKEMARKGMIWNEKILRKM